MATFRNQATLSYNGSSTTSNVVVGEITQVLSAAKYAPVDRYQTGDQLTFVDGSVALYQNGVLQEDPAATVTWDPITGAFTTVPGVATLVVIGTV